MSHGAVSGMWLEFWLVSRSVEGVIQPCDQDQRSKISCEAAPSLFLYLSCTRVALRRYCQWFA